MSQYDDCNPDCADGHVSNVTWTYRSDRGDFWAPDPPGLTPVRGAENYRAGS